MIGENAVMAWLNAIVALIGCTCGAYVLQRPALREATMSERFAVALAVVGLGMTALLPLTGSVLFDVGKLVLSTAVTIIFVTWVSWAANGKRREPPVQQPARQRW